MKNVMIFTVLGSLVLCGLAQQKDTEGNILPDAASLMNAKDQVLNFIQDPEDVGTLGKKSSRVLPIAGLEKLEYQLKGGHDDFDYEQWRKETKGDSESSLQSISQRNADLSQLVDYNRRYRKYGEDSKEDLADFEVVRQGFGKAAAQGFEGLLMLANALEAHDADSDGKLTKAEFVTALRGVPADPKEEKVRKAGKLDKDPEGLYELLRVDEAEQVDIGAFIEGVAHAITPRGVSFAKTAQEQANGSTITAEDALNFIESRAANAAATEEASQELMEAMQNNAHTKRYVRKADAVMTEAARQVDGLQKSIDNGDGDKLAMEGAEFVGREAGKVVGAAVAQGPTIETPEDVKVNIEKGKGFAANLQKEFDHYKSIQQEVEKEEEEHKQKVEKLRAEGKIPQKQVKPTFKVKVNDEVYELMGNARQFYKNVDKVMSEADVDHKTAAQALAEADGSIKEAVADLKGDTDDDGKQVSEDAWKQKTVENAKEAWQNLKDRAKKQQNKAPAPEAQKSA